MEQFANNPTTTLTTSGGINTTATSFAVASASAFPTTGNFRILVDGELMLVTGVSGSTLTVTRAAESTTPTAHLQGATIYGILTAGALNALVSIQSGGTDTSDRRVINFVSGATVADNSGAGRCDITIAGLPAIAQYDLLANTASGSQVPVATTLTALIDGAFGNTEGNILYRGASAWSVLAPGTAGQALITGGSSAIPSWGAGGSSVGYGVASSRPAAGNKGNIYIPSNGLITSLDTGSAWVGLNPFGATFIIPPISSSGWSQLESGSQTLTDIPGGGIDISYNAVSLGTEGSIGLVRTVSVPYTVTCCILPALIGFSGNDTAGIMISDGTKTLVFGRGADGENLNVFSNTALTSGSLSTSALSRPCMPTGTPLWLQIVNNSTNRIFSWSSNGVVWHQALSQTTGTTLTETEIGIGFMCNGNNQSASPPSQVLLSWTGA